MEIYKTKNWPNVLDGVRCVIKEQKGDKVTIQPLNTDIELKGNINNLSKE